MQIEAVIFDIGNVLVGWQTRDEHGWQVHHFIIRQGCAVRLVAAGLQHTEVGI